jgi:predicted PurR-regulated permease PerM
VILYYSRNIAIASLIGVGIAVLFSPLLDFLQRWLKLKRGFAALLLIALLFLFFSTLMFLFGWILTDQVQSLIENLPETSEIIQQKMTGMATQFPWVREQIAEIDFAAAAQKSLQYIVSGTMISFTAIGGVLFSLIIGIYLAVDKDFYFAGLVRAFKPSHRKRARDILVKCAHVVRVWFRAQLIDMAIIGLITTAGLWMVGVQYWSLFGVLTAILGIIPYVGVIIVVTITSLITLTSNPSQVPWVLLVFFVTQQVEGNIVLPMVMNGQAEVPEALLIIVMLFFGFWFHLLGVFIAPPLLAVFICLYRELYLPAIEKA